MIRVSIDMTKMVMDQHIDHIQSLFDGDKNPILSVVANLNDDYDGGQLYFWSN